jgi:hypothetical protein
VGLRWVLTAGLAVALAQAPPQGEPVLRITVTLVQVDAIVTDRSGRQVRDLKAEDFELLQDGRPQKITHFSYVSTEAPAERASSGPARRWRMASRFSTHGSTAPLAASNSRP